MSLLGLPWSVAWITEQYLSIWEGIPKRYLELASVNREFRAFFLCDRVWQRFNVYGVMDIAHHYISGGERYRQLEMLLLQKYLLIPEVTREYEPIVWKMFSRLQYDSTPHYQLGNRELAEYTPELLHKDKEFVLDLLCNQTEFTTFKLFQDDEDVVLITVTLDRSFTFRALKAASMRLQHNKKIVLALVRKGGCALLYARILDKDIVLEAVKNCGTALGHAHARYRSDIDIALAAVQNDGLALQYVSRELQDHDAIVLAAVRNNSFALRFASKRLNHCLHILLTALIQSLAELAEQVRAQQAINESMMIMLLTFISLRLPREYQNSSGET